MISGESCRTSGPLAFSTRFGSGPVAPFPNSRSGSGRHSIRISIRAPHNQTDFRNLDRQKRRVEDEVVDVDAADRNGRLPIGKEAAPKRQVVIDILVSFVLEPSRGPPSALE